MSTTAPVSPYFKVHKSALATIERLSEGRVTAHCKAVYIALRWLANNQASPEGPVTLPINDIASKTPCSYRKAFDSLKKLEGFGIISIERKVDLAGDRAPSTYGFCTPCMTSCTPCIRLCTESTRKRADSIKEKKESKSCEQSATPPLRDTLVEAAKPRSPDPVLRFLVGIGGGDPVQATASAWGAARKAKKEIRTVCPAVTEAELSRRSANYRQHFTGASITALALAKHWATCDHPPTNGSARPGPVLREVSML